MSISDADLLDTVRRLRSYMSVIDNCHVVLGKLSDVEDKIIADAVLKVLPEIMSTSTKVSQTLKILENSKIYRDMIKKFNLKDAATNNEDEDDEQW